MANAWLHQLIQGMQVVQHAGWLGWLLFIGAYALCCLFFLPGSVLTIGAGAIYGFWGGTLLVLLGNGVGSILNLLVTRYLFRNWAKRRVAKNPRLNSLKKAVARDDMKLVFLSRLSPVMPFSLINYALGLTDISIWRFLLATELGALPANGIYVYIGKLMGSLARIAPELKKHRAEEWIAQGAGLVIAIGVTVYITRLASKALHRGLKSRA